jgi:ATP-binding cassette subfamily F protein 3
MAIISVSKLSKSFSHQTLFQNVSFVVNEKNKIALIGANGTGKSTLLKIIMNLETADSGDVSINKDISIGYLTQESIRDIEKTIEEVVLEEFEDVLRLERLLKSITNDFALDPQNDDLMKQYGNIEHAYMLKGGYEYHYKINLLLTKFGFSSQDKTRLVSTLSGGEKTRLAFAKLLLREPDLLILDEPTNHLDIDIISWLEDYLNKYEKAILMVTHDKYFLTKVTQSIIEIDQMQLHRFSGTFEQYQEEKVKRYEVMLKNYQRQQKEIAHLQSFVDRFRYNGKRASLAQDRIKKIDRIDKIEKPSNHAKSISFSFESLRPTKEVIMEFSDIILGYDQPLNKPFSFTMRGFESVAVVGANGVGKTTLLKTVLGQLNLIDGEIIIHRKFKIGYFSQTQSRLHDHKTIFEEIHDLYPHYTRHDIHSVCGRFLFSADDVYKSISFLSGGEKVRLVLLLLMLEEPSFLILDEPTNHLDITSKDVVEDVLSEYTGPILLVSHDRFLIDKIATKLIHFSKNEVDVFEGNYTDYLNSKNSESVSKQKSTPSLRKPKINIDKEIEHLENKLLSIEARLESIKEEMFKEENYVDINKMNKLKDEEDLLLYEHEQLYKKLEEIFTIKEE